MIFRQYSCLTIVGASLTLLQLSGCAPPAPEFDLLIRGGTLVDGTGASRRSADVAIQGDRIVAIAPDISGDRASEVLDATGLIVAPGFWDNHAHLVELEDHPTAENFLRQGITTIIASLHSQQQVYPMAPYRQRVRMAPNVGLYAGHTWIREQVLGLEKRPPTAAELEAMKEYVHDAMRAGALGLATGLEYVPAVYAELDEIVALAEVAASYGGLYSTHMRDEGVRVLEAVEETLAVGRRAGIPVQINHHKVTGAAQFGWTEHTLAMITAARAEGLEVAVDLYPYTAYSTYSDLMFPAWALADGPDAFAARVADPATRQRMASEMLDIFPRQTGAEPSSIQFREVPERLDLQGQTLADYLAEKDRPATIPAAVDALIELQLAGGFIGIFHGMSEADIERVLGYPDAMFETDGDLVTPGVGHPHPRSYGALARVLGRYTREKGVLTLEEAVRRMTSVPAAWHGQAERGMLGEDMLADIVVFDEATIGSRATYTDPHHYADGVVHLLINGELVLRAGEVTNSMPGRFLDRGRRDSARTLGGQQQGEQ